MAKETEIERLVVRIMGEDSDYKAKMENSVKEAEKLVDANEDLSKAIQTTSKEAAKEAESLQEATKEVEKLVKLKKELNKTAKEAKDVGVQLPFNLGNASKTVSLSDREANLAYEGKLLDSINDTPRAASRAVGGINDIGVAYSKLGAVIALVGTSIKATEFIIENSIKYQAHEMEQAVKNYKELEAMTQEATSNSASGNQFMRDKRTFSEASGFGKQKYYQQMEKEAKLRAEQQALEQKQAMERLALSDTGGYQRIWGDFKALLGGHVNSEAALSSKQEQDKIDLNQRTIQAKRQEEDATRNYYKSLREETQALHQATRAGEVYIDSKNKIIGWQEKLTEAARQSQANYHSARMAVEANASYNFFRPGHEMEAAFAQTRDPILESKDHNLEEQNDITQAMYKEADRTRMENYFTLEKEHMEDRLKRIGLIGKEEARQAAIDQALQQGKTKEQAAALGDLAARIKLGEAEHAYNLEMERTTIQQKYFNSELRAAANPREIEINAATKAAKAYELWAQANKDLVATKGEEMKAIFAANAAQEVSLQLLQEGASLQEKFMLPQRRAMLDMERLKKIKGLGGFGEGANADWTYMKASAEAYGKAHKDYSSERQRTSFGALSTVSSDATKALYDYKLGVTAIPKAQMEAQQKEKTDKDKVEKDKLKALNGLRTDIGKLIEKLTEKETIELSLANLSGEE